MTPIVSAAACANTRVSFLSCLLVSRLLHVWFAESIGMHGPCNIAHLEVFRSVAGGRSVLTIKLIPLPVSLEEMYAPFTPASEQGLGSPRRRAGLSIKCMGFMQRKL